MALKRLVVFMLFTLFLSSLAVMQLRAEEAERVAVLDFAVQSDRPEYQYLGKGFAEFVAVEISAHPRIRLIDRHMRNTILEEQKIGLTGLTDETSALELGRLLTVRYLVNGKIFDMMGQLVITWSLLDAETGEVVATKRVDGRPQEYNRITDSIAKNIIDSLGLSQAQLPSTYTPEIAEEKGEEVLTEFSAVVDAYDRKDVAEAEKRLNRVSRIDPQNPAIRHYLELLAVYTSRFKVVAAPYYPLENPAALPRLNRDVLYFNTGSAMVGLGFLGGKDWPPNEGKKYPLSNTYDGEEFGVHEMDNRLTVGYRAPLGQSFGWGFELFTSSVNSVFQVYDLVSENRIDSTYYGGIASFGWALTPGLSVGVSGTGAYSSGEYTVASNTKTHHIDFEDVFFAASLGFLLKNNTGSLVYGVYGGWSNQIWYMHDLENYDPDTTATDLEDNPNNPKEGDAPYYLDQTLSIGFHGNRSFLIVKHMADFWPAGGPQPYMQLLGAMERRIAHSFSLRGGAGYAFTIGETVEGGPGGNLGFTWTFLDQWEFDSSASVRYRPSKVEPDEIVPEFSFTLGLSRSGLFDGR